MKRFNRKGEEERVHFEAYMAILCEYKDENDLIPPGHMVDDRKIQGVVSSQRWNYDCRMWEGIRYKSIL